MSDDDTPPKDAPRIGTFVCGGYPDEDAQLGVLRIQFRNVEDARRLAKIATDAAEILESGKGAAYTHFSLGTFRAWRDQDTS